MIKDTKKFDGKTYKLVTHYFRKGDAEAAQSRLKRKGHLARITSRRGISGRLFYLWARRR